jgi:hypothetical protein
VPTDNTENSSDEDSNQSDVNSSWAYSEFSPPQWIQGTWSYSSGGTIKYYIFTENNVIRTGTTRISFQDQADWYNKYKGKNGYFKEIENTSSAYRFEEVNKDGLANYYTFEKKSDTQMLVTVTYYFSTSNTPFTYTKFSDE